MDDAACFQFLLQQVRAERPVVTARSRAFIGKYAPLTGGHVPTREATRHHRAVTTSDRTAALTFVRTLSESGERGWIEAQALFPALYVLNQEIAAGGRRAVNVRWLKDSLLGVPLAALAERSGRAEADVRRAVNSVARRICRNDLPRRFRDDVAIVAAGAFGS